MFLSESSTDAIIDPTANHDDRHPLQPCTPTLLPAIPATSSSHNPCYDNVSSLDKRCLSDIDAKGACMVQHWLMELPMTPVSPQHPPQTQKAIIHIQLLNANLPLDDAVKTFDYKLCLYKLDKEC